MVEFVDKYFKCPVCGERMISDLHIAQCIGQNKHSFDLSSSGYLNLALGHKGAGDSKESVKARSAFLSKGAYRKIAEEISKKVNKYAHSGVLVDTGCGEGYYTNLLAERNKDMYVIGLDLSKYAIDAASRSSKRSKINNSFFSVANIFNMPLIDRCADIITNIFAPCAEDDFYRVLSNDGLLILCGAGREHLIELKRLIYDDVYTNGKRNDLPDKNLFSLIDKSLISYHAVIGDNYSINDLFSMTPYYWRTSVKDKDKLKNIDSLEVKIEVELFVYKKVLQKGM